MKLNRFSGTAAALAAGALLLTACGSDNNAGTGDAGNAAAAKPADSSCFSGTLNAEGSSAQQNAIDEAIANYTATCADATINYNPTGSGAGIKQFNDGQVDFAGSDSALKEDEGEVAAAKKRCGGNDAWNLPMVVGPIAMAYNLPGVDKLVLTPEVAAKISPARSRPGTTRRSRPSTRTPRCRAGHQGVLPLATSPAPPRTSRSTWPVPAAAPGPTSRPRSGRGPARVARSPSGVADGVKTTEGSITYVEWSYAKDNGLGIAQVDNGSGPVELTGEAVGNAIAAAKQAGTGNDLRLKLDYATKAAGAYPIDPGHLRDRLLQGPGRRQG